MTGLARPRSRVLPFARRELRSAFESPVAYVAIGLFVLLLPALFFFLGYPVGVVPLPGLWEGGQASLIVLFHWLPLLLAFVVPALCMGSWSEERRAGTEEVLLTYPVSVAAVAGGKFLASWLLAFLMTALATLSAALTVAALGDLTEHGLGRAPRRGLPSRGLRRRGPVPLRGERGAARGLPPRCPRPGPRVVAPALRTDPAR